MKIKPNPEFLKSAPIEARRKWAKALVECPHGQARKAMVRANQHGQQWCCLQVGHDAFGGTREQRDDIEPRKDSPFYRAMGGSDPDIGVDAFGRLISASGCNDTHELTFTQIAHLVCPEDFPEAS